MPAICECKDATDGERTPLQEVEGEETKVKEVACLGKQRMLHEGTGRKHAHAKARREAKTLGCQNTESEKQVGEK